MKRIVAGIVLAFALSSQEAAAQASPDCQAQLAQRYGEEFLTRVRPGTMLEVYGRVEPIGEEFIPEYCARIEAEQNVLRGKDSEITRLTGEVSTARASEETMRVTLQTEREKYRLVPLLYLLAAIGTITVLVLFAWKVIPFFAYVFMIILGARYEKVWKNRSGYVRRFVGWRSSRKSGLVRS